MTEQDKKEKRKKEKMKLIRPKRIVEGNGKRRMKTRKRGRWKYRKKRKKNSGEGQENKGKRMEWIMGRIRRQKCKESSEVEAKDERMRKRRTNITYER